jgi:DNA mismatch repair protein MutL
MSDIIKLLPDSIANQIAAGEVIQRPASVIKELLENSIDAGATEINIVIKDAGKTLIQVIDNGKGMSETDARMCFERHATSKIRKSEDLYKINTMGFRGEAMASIASIAMVQLETKTEGRELGTKIVIKGSAIITQEACSTPVGTNLQIKNLFYNVPARRKFLKSDPTELKHLCDEFIRIALAHPEIHFSLHHNDNEMYHLAGSNLRQRIVAILGKSYNEKLVPVEESSDWIVINGFIGKAEFAKRTKGEQFFFVNKRFIRSNYLNHAIKTAYEDLVPKENYPLYVLFIKIDPSKIDINVHPTKQEIKFEEERLIYNYVRVAVRHAIGKYTLTPVIDFETSSPAITMASTPKKNPEVQSFSSAGFSRPKNPDQARINNNRKEWQSIYEGLQDDAEAPSEDDGGPMILKSELSDPLEIQEKANTRKKPFQMQKSYIITQIKSGLMIIDQQAAHERILYEKHLQGLQEGTVWGQTQLFSETVELSPGKAEVLKSILSEVNRMGFEIDEFGNNSFIVRGLPVGFKSKEGLTRDIEKLVEDYMENVSFSKEINSRLAQTLAYASCLKRGTSLEEAEMQDLIDQLFACETPYKSPTGRKCFITMELDDIKKRFTEE